MFVLNIQKAAQKSGPMQYDSLDYCRRREETGVITLVYTNRERRSKDECLDSCQAC